MKVLKRNGKYEDIHYDKITARLVKLTYGLNTTYIDVSKITQKIIVNLYDGVKTTEIDDMCSEYCASCVSLHPDFGKLAARIFVSNHHKQTEKKFSTVFTLLRNTFTKHKEPQSLISDAAYNFMLKHQERIDSAIVLDRDYDFDFFGVKTLYKSYLMKKEGKVVETPQHMYMRVAIGIHCYTDDIDQAIKTYNELSTHLVSFGSPTFFNASTQCNQMSSCYLLPVFEDSVYGIYETLKRYALISKGSGGIGSSITNVRAKGSEIRGSNGVTNGLLPMMRVFNEGACHINQGGRRPAGEAFYIEVWHPEVEQVCEIRKNTGLESQRARDLFVALWIDDLFMKRVKNNEKWSFMCPDECPGLSEVYGEEFEKLYTSYEERKMYRKQIDAQTLFRKICESISETGVPYMLSKDNCNKKSNQQNLGTIKSSNLCTEIVEFSSKDEVAVCNLGALNLPQYVTDDGDYDFEKLHQVTKQLTFNLNKIIDINYYPIPEAKYSNLKNRPIGIGVIGLQEVFFKLGLPFTSPKAKLLNKQIFETIYHAAIEASCDLAEKYGKPYDSYQGSPLEKDGKLQFDFWPKQDSYMYDWKPLRERIKQHGVYNSLTTAPMPTATTAQILGNTECFEPINSNIFTRRVISGDFQVVNSYLINDLIKLGIYTDELRNKILIHKGSVQFIDEIPQDLKDLYKTVWEISQKEIVSMALDRSPFIDQSQSLNIHMVNPTYAKLASLYFYCYENGMKTWSYYLRSKPAVNAIQFTIDPKQIKLEEKKLNLEKKVTENKKEMEKKKIVCTDDVCTSCSL